MRASALGLVLILAACGSGGEAPNGAADVNQIERLATPRQPKPDPHASVRLQVLTVQDLELEGLIGAGCYFVRDGRMLLAAVGSDSLVRIGGALRHLVPSAPVGGTGGFFEDRQLSVSVGRTSEAGTAAGEATSWPARISITNRRTGARIRLRGVWTCGA